MLFLYNLMIEKVQWYILFYIESIRANTHDGGVPKMPIQNAVTYYIIIVIINNVLFILIGLLIIGIFNVKTYDNNYKRSLLVC